MTEMLTVNVGCCLCAEHHCASIPLPDGWQYYDEMVDAESGFCPAHAPIKAFADAQCPGCIGGWGDCPLWESFAYSYKRSLTDDDFATIETGRCPKRVTGTFSVANTTAGVSIENIDLSTTAPVESGLSLAAAIRAYWEKYPG